MENEALIVILVLFAVASLIVGGWFLLRKNKPATIVKLDYDETVEPSIRQQRQLEDDLMHDGMGGHNHHYPHY